MQTGSRDFFPGIYVQDCHAARPRQEDPDRHCRSVLERHRVRAEQGEGVGHLPGNEVFYLLSA